MIGQDDLDGSGPKTRYKRRVAGQYAQLARLARQRHELRLAGKDRFFCADYVNMQVGHVQSLLEFLGFFEGFVDRANHVESLLRSEEHTSELQSLMRISYAVFCSKTTNIHIPTIDTNV